MVPVLLLAACAPDDDPVPPAFPAGGCFGQAVVTVDGEAVQLEQEVRDAELRVIEEAQRSLVDGNGWRSWTEWVRDADGVDRIDEQRQDLEDDGQVDHLLLRDWTLDERLRLVWEVELLDGRPFEEWTYAYDDDDHLIASARFVEAVEGYRSEQRWEDDRLVERVSYVGEEVVQSVARVYLEPPPSLDHLEAVDPPAWSAPAMRRDYDDLGRLGGEWVVAEDGSELQVTSLVYDERGRLVEEVRRWGPSPDTAPEHRVTNVWRDDGLLQTRTDEVVEGPGSDVVVEWTWSCG